MIHKQQHVSVQGSLPTLRSRDFSIHASYHGHIMDMLVKNYSLPERAVVREYVSNSVDAHRMARAKNPGIVLPPIQITMPTSLNPTFTVRDFGVGMGLEETEELLSNFGASGEGKRQSDRLIGGFGIGSKAAFAITDTYTYIVWHGGVKRTWLCTVKPTAERALSLLAEEPSDEPVGVMVSVPIPPNSVLPLTVGLQYVLTLLDEPVEVDGTLKPPATWVKVPVGPKVELWYSPENLPGTEKLSLVESVAVGDFVYPISNSQYGNAYSGNESLTVKLATAGTKQWAGQKFDGDKYPVMAAISSGRFLLRFAPGSITPAPSREQLLYDTDAVGLVRSGYKELDRLLAEELKVIIDGQPDAFSAMRTAISLATLGAYKYPYVGMNNVMKYGGNPITWQDLKPVRADSPEIRKNLKVVTKLHGRRLKKRVRMSPIVNDNGNYAARRAPLSESALKVGNMEKISKLPIEPAEAQNAYVVSSGATFWHVGQMETVCLYPEAITLLEIPPGAGYQIEDSVADWMGQHSSDTASKIVLVLSGTPEERQKIKAALPFLELPLHEELLELAPKRTFIRDSDGEARADRARGYSRGWYKATPNGWEQCLIPDKGPIYVRVRSDEYETVRMADERKTIAGQLCHLQVVLGPSVPELRSISGFYECTECGMETYLRRKGDPKSRLLPLLPAVNEWLKVWVDTPSPVGMPADLAILSGGFTLLDENGKAAAMPVSLELPLIWKKADDRNENMTEYKVNWLLDWWSAHILPARLPVGSLAEAFNQEAFRVWPGIKNPCAVSEPEYQRLTSAINAAQKWANVDKNGDKPGELSLPDDILKKIQARMQAFLDSATRLLEASPLLQTTTLYLEIMAYQGEYRRVQGHMRRTKKWPDMLAGITDEIGRAK